MPALKFYNACLVLPIVDPDGSPETPMLLHLRSPDRNHLGIGGFSNPDGTVGKRFQLTEAGESKSMRMGCTG